MENPRTLSHLVAYGLMSLTKYTKGQIQVSRIAWVDAKCKDANSCMCKHERSKSVSTCESTSTFEPSAWTQVALILLNEEHLHPFHSLAPSILTYTTPKILRRTINASVVTQSARWLLFVHNLYCTCHYCTTFYYQSEQLKSNLFQIVIHFLPSSWCKKKKGIQSSNVSWEDFQTNKQTKKRWC